MFLIACIALLALSSIVDCQKSVSKSTGPPAFFLLDPSDGLCLAGSIYKRCAIDTLWYVTGKPGSYQIRHRVVDENDDESCLDRAQCHLEESNVKLANCNHCGAKKWNIRGEAATGYALTEDGSKNCLKRDGVDATMIRCEKGYSQISLQFVTTADIARMSSEGARLIDAAIDGDLSSVKDYLNDKVDVDSRDWGNSTALMGASKAGNIDVVKHLLSKKASVNLQDKDNITALSEAAMRGHTFIVELLLKAGADVHVSTSAGVTALWLAASEGHTDIVKLLLLKGADSNNARFDGITVLMVSSASGQVEVVEELLKYGASVNLADREGLTALIGAAEKGDVEIVELLLAAGAEVNIMSEAGFSPLIIASAHGHVDVVRRLVAAGAEMELEHPQSVTPLMYASAGGFPEIVQLLVDNHAQINVRHKEGGSALLEAATAGNVTVVQILLDAGADVFIVDMEGITPLMSAASQGHTEVCRMLIAKGLNKVNQVAQSGGTAIMFAAGAGHNETTSYLIEQGADVNIVVTATQGYIERTAQLLSENKEGVEPHKDGVTALSAAAEGGHFGTVKLLVEAGAVVDITDEEDVTPLLAAIKAKSDAVAIYLLEHGANPNDVFVDDKMKPHNILMNAVIEANITLALLLIEKGAGLTYADEEGVTIITQAAYQGQLSVVNALLARGADPSISNVEGINALIAAASEGHDEVVGALIASQRLDVNAKDKDGTSALMAAAVRGHKGVIMQIIAAGGNLDAQNVDGHTALMFAYNGKNQVETLLDKYKDYIHEDADGSIKIIKEALAIHVEVVDLLIRSGADISIQDKEGHVAADFDFKPAELELAEDVNAPDNHVEL